MNNILMNWLKRLVRRQECRRDGHLWATVQHVPGADSLSTKSSGGQGWRMQVCVTCYGLRGHGIPEECCLESNPPENVLWPALEHYERSLVDEGWSVYRRQGYLPEKTDG